MIEISNVSKTYETGNKAIKDVSTIWTWEGCREGMFPNTAED